MYPIQVDADLHIYLDLCEYISIYLSTSLSFPLSICIYMWPPRVRFPVGDVLAHQPHHL